MAWGAAPVTRPHHPRPRRLDHHDARLGLSLPPDPAMLRVVRLVASGITTLTDLGLDDVERVRTVADELVRALVRSSDGARVLVWFTLDGDQLTISATTRGRGTHFEPGPAVEQVLAGLTVSHAWHSEGRTLAGTAVCSLTGQ